MRRNLLIGGGAALVCALALLFVITTASGGPDPIPTQPPGEGPVAFTEFEIPRADGGTATLRAERVLSEHLDISRAQVLASGPEGMAILGPGVKAGQVCLVFEQPGADQVLTCASEREFARAGLYASAQRPGAELSAAFVAPEEFEMITLNGTPLASTNGAAVFSVARGTESLELVARSSTRVISLEARLTPGP